MPTYAYRVRVDLPPDLRLVGDSEPAALGGPSGWELRPVPAAGSFATAYGFEIRRGGHSTPAQARDAGARMLDYLRLAGVATSAAFDTGWSPATRIMSEALPAATTPAERAAVRLRPDIPGADVYEEGDGVTFASLVSGGGTGNRGVAHLADIIAAVERASPTLSDMQRTACELLLASLAAERGRAKLVLAAAAYECLLKPAKRGFKARGLVKEFEDAVAASGLSDAEQASLCGTLRHLRRESITQCGAGLAERLLAGKTYDGDSPGAFFKRFYGARSQLVHRGKLVGEYKPVSAMAEYGLHVHSSLPLISAAQTFVRDAILSTAAVIKYLPPGPLVIEFGPDRL